MSLFFFLTVVQAIIAAALVGAILMQRSEGGGLGMGGGGSPAGLMSARGAADFMTRTTAILAILFVVLSIVLAAIAVGATSGREIDTTLDRSVAPVVQGDLPVSEEGSGNAGDAQVPADDPLAGAAQ